MKAFVNVLRPTGWRRLARREQRGPKASRPPSASRWRAETGQVGETLEPICIRMEKEARHQPALKVQTLGEGLQARQMEKLNRYEMHLDRKVERTLAILVKLKELRTG